MARARPRSLRSGDTTATSDSDAGSKASSTTASPKSSTPASTKRPTTPTTVAVALPRADLKAPPDPPVGLYRRGRVFLEGSVPTDAAAVGYQRKLSAILGKDNVEMRMKLDRRVPASPMRIIVQEQFQFPTGSFEVSPKYEALLNLGVFALKELPEAKLVITGYTDNVGPAEVNQSLSEQHPQVVVDWMVKGGIPARRVVALGRGPADPIADNDTESGRQKNRRIEATLDGVTPT